MSDIFERERAAYEQNFEQARSLNTQMNQVPAIAMTLTGGLWFAAALTEAELAMEIRFALLTFAGLCNLSLICAILRIRDVFQSYLEKLKAFHPPAFASGRPQRPKVAWLGNYGMIFIYCALMVIAAVFSFIAAFWKYWPFDFSVCWGVAALIAVLAVIFLFVFMRGDVNADAAGD